MADRIGTNEELRTTIVAGFEAMGCPPGKAREIVQAGFDAHNDIEGYRAAVVKEVSAAFPDVEALDYIDANLLLLIVQLEMAHLHQVFHFLKGQLGMTDDAGGETIQ
jgi:hypothetical protein